MPWIILAVIVGIAGFMVFEGTNLVNVTTDTSQNYSAAIVTFARAIARAEGYGVPGAVPTLANNPGDLVMPGWTGSKLGSGISVFQNTFTGWDHLYKELELIVLGNSAVYSLTDTIADMAAKWTQTDQTNWALIVSQVLGVGADAPLSSVLN